MRKVQKILAALLIALLATVLYFFWISREPDSVRQARAVAKAKRENNTLVDQSPLKTAQQLAPLAVTHRERALAKEALRLADYEVDLTFDAALHQALLNPPPLSPEAKAIEDRIKKAENLLKADEDRAKQLSEQLAKAPPDKQDGLQVQLVQAQADMELDQDELDDAKEDFARAGGNLADRIRALKKEHEETAHNSETALATSTPPADQLGLIHRVKQWLGLRNEKRQLQDAKDKSDAAAASLEQQHNTLDERLEQEKEKSPDLARHTKRRTEAAAGNQSPAVQRTAEESAALLQKTEQIAADQKLLATFDKRVEAHKELSGIYAQWFQAITDRQWAVAHQGFAGILIVLVIALVGLFFGTWMNSLVNRLSMDRRQITLLCPQFFPQANITATGLPSLVQTRE